MKEKETQILKHQRDNSNNDWDIIELNSYIPIKTIFLFLIYYYITIIDI